MPKIKNYLIQVYLKLVNLVGQCLNYKEEQVLFRYLNTTNLSFSRKQKVAMYLAGGDADGETVRACTNAFKTGEHIDGNGRKVCLRQTFHPTQS